MHLKALLVVYNAIEKVLIRPVKGLEMVIEGKKDEFALRPVTANLTTTVVMVDLSGIKPS